MSYVPMGETAPISSPSLGSSSLLPTGRSVEFVGDLDLKKIVFKPLVVENNKAKV